jgi:adenylate kinase family enzyme
MRLIVVVGCPGSGKTSLALKLGRKLALPVVHLDVLYWRPGWKACDKASFRVRVAEAIRGDGWVVDGSFSELALDLTPGARRYIDRHRALAMALPMADRVAFGLRSQWAAARLA